MPELYVARGGIWLKLRPPPHLERVLAAPQARDEVAERIVEDIGADPCVRPVAAAAGDVAGVHVPLTEREGIPSVEADEPHIVVEVGLRPGAELLTDAADTQHVGGAVAQHGGVRAR